MKNLLILACLLLPFAALAQSETCPRIWRSGDSLLTDPAPQVQWLRDGQPIPDANQRWFLPTEAGRYSVQATGAPSEAFTFSAENRYALAGYVFDEQHRPVEDATVRSGAFSATTDVKGRFVLAIEGAKPAERTPVVVSVEKDGYWRNTSRQYISRFYTTETQLMLHTRRVSNRVDATKGGEMAYRGFTLQLPPNAVQTESGTPYNGTILLSVEGATPSDPDFGLRMPGGDFAAIDEGGNDVMLYSYGYLSVEMTTESGEKLELRPEARATLRFYLPYTETLRPDSVPLWHFNTETAVWEQEGWSVRNGSIYEGQVSHFSSWNCDWPAERSTVRGQVIDCIQQPVKGGWVRVGQRQVTSDGEGNYWTFVPSNVAFDVWTQSDTLRDISVPAQEERTLEDLTGLNFSGVAVYNPQTQALSVYLSGNVPDNLQLSVDGGQSWTEEREFTGIAQAPDSALLEGACTDRLRVFILPRAEDCQLLDSLGLANARGYTSWQAAFASEAVVHRLRLLGNFGGQWELLFAFPCLSELNLLSNQLTDLPAFIGDLTSLQKLILNANQLTDLPAFIGNLTNLRALELASNQLTDLPESIGDLTNLQSLGLGYNQLADLPESIGNLTNLQSLGLAGIQLTALPAFIGNLTKLQTLMLGYNELTDLPESIGNLTNLRVLHLEENQLVGLPESIGNLTNLRVLSLYTNQLTDLPESMGNQTNLQELYLNANQLTALPESTGNLTKLQVLWLGANQLTALPAFIGNLTRLGVLRLDNNQLTDLPASIANLADTLVDLDLSGNPIPVERRAAIQALLPSTRILW